jgi:hypothetical protein
MNVGVNLTKAGLRAGSVCLTLMAFVAAASTHNNVPGKRHGTELESRRTFSSEIVRDLQSPDRARAVRTALALGQTKDNRAFVHLILRFLRRGRDAGVRPMSINRTGFRADSMFGGGSPIVAALTGGGTAA